MIIYLAGPYSGNIDKNIEAARKVAIQAWEAGHVAITPHLNTAHFELDCKAMYEDYLRGYLAILAKADAILMLPGWENSSGARAELSYAKAAGIPIFYYPELPNVA